MNIRQLFDYDTWTFTYLLWSNESNEALLIDPVLEQVERDLSLIKKLGLSLKLVLETHVHADHITGASVLKEKTGDFPTERIIDAINPLSWFKTGNILSKRRYDLVIFRFWNPFFAPALGVIAGVIIKKSPNTKLISLCDNILPHERVS